eukprot:5895195-Pyramimonas_sp.AAC.1
MEDGFQTVALALAPRTLELHGLRKAPLKNVRLALAPRTLVLKNARASRIEGGSFSKCGSRLGAAHTRLKNLQELHGLRANPFQNVALSRLNAAHTLP